LAATIQYFFLAGISLAAAARPARHFPALSGIDAPVRSLNCWQTPLLTLFPPHLDTQVILSSLMAMWGLRGIMLQRQIIAIAGNI